MSQAGAYVIVYQGGLSACATQRSGALEIACHCHAFLLIPFFSFFFSSRMVMIGPGTGRCSYALCYLSWLVGLRKSSFTNFKFKILLRGLLC